MAPRSDDENVDTVGCSLAKNLCRVTFENDLLDPYSRVFGGDLGDELGKASPYLLFDGGVSRGIVRQPACVTLPYHERLYRSVVGGGFLDTPEQRPAGAL